MGGSTMKQRYDSYKPSGIDWIGDIPSHWSVMPVKHILDNLDYLRQPISAEDRERNNPKYDYYGASGVIDQIDFYNVDDTVLLIGEDGANLVMRNLPLIYRASGKFWVNNHAHILKPKNGHNYSYLAHLLEAGDYTLFITGSAQPKLSQENLNKYPICIPPLAEQEAIAAWLDEKCEDIDAAIAKVDREIELIDELKQSEISRVVTRGLNPDTPLRPSGIDWIGDIPEHWTKCRLKFIGSARNGLTYSPSDVKDSGKLVIRSSNIQDSKLNYDDCVFVANYPETLSVNSGDTIICSRNGSINLIGKSVFIEDDMDVTFGAFMMRFRPYEHPKYSHYLLSIAISRYKGLFATTTINQLTADSLGKMEAVMPPYMEQVQIADYLDKKCAAIDGLKAKLIKKRETLTELRQSIISEVVTGKRKVI